MRTQATCDTARWFPAVPAFLAKRSLSPDIGDLTAVTQVTRRREVVALSLATVDPFADQDQLVICESGAGGETDVELRHSRFIYRSCPLF